MSKIRYEEKISAIREYLAGKGTPFGNWKKYYFFEKVLQKVFHYREKRGVYGNYDGTV